MVHARYVHQRDHENGEHLAETEHELPAATHLLTLSLRHRFHDVGIAVGNIAAERNADQQTHDDQVPDVAYKSLRDRQDDEEHHRADENLLSAEAIGEDAAQESADQRAALHGR